MKQLLILILTVFACISVFSAEPMLNTKSPVSGAHINGYNPPVTYEHDGVIIGFANPIEVSKFKINPRRYLKKFAWHDMGATLISKENFKRLLDGRKKVFIVDALTDDYYSKARIKGAINIQSEHVNAIAPKLIPNKDSIIVTYCYRYKCHASTKAAVAFQKAGYKNVYDYKGGFVEWKEFYPELIDHTPPVLNVNDHIKHSSSYKANKYADKTCSDKKWKDCTSKKECGDKKWKDCSAKKECGDKKWKDCSAKKGCSEKAIKMNCNDKNKKSCSTVKDCKSINDCSTKKCCGLEGCKGKTAKHKSSELIKTGCDSTPKGCCGEVGCKEYK